MIVVRQHTCPTKEEAGCCHYLSKATLLELLTPLINLHINWQLPQPITSEQGSLSRFIIQYQTSESKRSKERTRNKS
jgi:hypothetical protein